MAAEVPFRYRVIVAAILLAAFVVFSGLYEFGYRPAFVRILHFLGVPPATHELSYIDFHAILSAAECDRKGIDVYVTNPCDVKGRVHIYSPLWLTLIPENWDVTDTWWTGAALGLAFILSLAWLCPARDQWELWTFLVFCCSSAVIFAIERGNIDIVIFLLMIVAGKIFVSELLRPISYACVLLATALKFYPFVAFAILLADKPRRGLVLGGLGMVSALSLALFWRREIAAAAEYFPVQFMGTYLYFSAHNLVGSLAMLYPNRLTFLASHGLAVTIALLLLALLLAAISAITLRRQGVQLFLALEDTVLFLGGATMIVGCFITGHSHHYRAILLLFVVPLLMACRRDGSALMRLFGSVGLCLSAFALFEGFLRVNLLSASRMVDGLERPVTLIVWGLEQVLWWSLVTFLMTALLLIAWDSPVGLWVRRALGSKRPFAVQRV